MPARSRPARPTVEVAHEALLRQWPPLRDAIEADRAWLRLRSELERLAADWQQGQRDDPICCAAAGWPPSTSGRPATRRARPARARVPARQPRAGDARAGHGPPVQPTAARRWPPAWQLCWCCAAHGRRPGLASRIRRAQAQTRLALSRQLAAQADRLVDTRPDVAILAGLQSMSLARDQRPVSPRPG